MRQQVILPPDQLRRLAAAYDRLPRGPDGKVRHGDLRALARHYGLGVSTLFEKVKRFKARAATV